MKHQYFAFARWAALLVPASMALSGCLSSTPNWDKHFGEALKSVKEAQIIDPHAAEHAPSVQGVDGRAAASAMDTYEKSFQAPTPTPNAFVIGVGSGGSQ